MCEIRGPVLLCVIFGSSSRFICISYEISLSLLCSLNVLRSEGNIYFWSFV